MTVRASHLLQCLLKRSAEIGVQPPSMPKPVAGAPIAPAINLKPIKAQAPKPMGLGQTLGSVFKPILKGAFNVRSSRSAPPAAAPASSQAQAYPSFPGADVQGAVDNWKARGAQPASAPAPAAAAPAAAAVRSAPMSGAERATSTPEQVQAAHLAWTRSPEYKQMLAKNYAMNDAQGKAPQELQPYMGAATAALSKERESSAATPPASGTTAALSRVPQEQGQRASFTDTVERAMRLMADPRRAQDAQPAPVNPQLVTRGNDLNGGAAATPLGTAQPPAAATPPVAAGKTA